MNKPTDTYLHSHSIRRALAACVVLVLPATASIASAQTIFAVDAGSTLFSLERQGSGQWSTPATIGTISANARQLALDAAGNVYLAAYGNGALYRYGSPSTSGGAWTQTTLTSGLTVQAVTLDSNGTIYMGGAGINRITWNGSSWTRSASILTGDNTSNTISLVADAAGNLYAADYSSSSANARILKLSHDSATGSFADAEVFATGTGRVFSMVFDAAGNLYTANNTAGSVQIYACDASSGLSSVASTFLTGFTNLRAIAFDADGNLYVGGGGAGTGYLYRYDRTDSGLSTTKTVILENHAYAINGLAVTGGAIPEPSTCALLTGAVMAAWVWVRRKRRNQ